MKSPLPFLAQYTFLIGMWLSVASFGETTATAYKIVGKDIPKVEGRGADMDRAVKSIVHETNKFRKANNLDAVKTNKTLTKTAQAFADFMARTSRYGHHADGRKPSDRAKAGGYDYCSISENIAFCQKSEAFETVELAHQFFTGWKNSPGHRENMLGRFSMETGVAISRSEETGGYFAVQLFARPGSATTHFRVENLSKQAVRYSLSNQTEKNEVPEWEERNVPLRGTHIYDRCYPLQIKFSNSEQKPFDVKDGAHITISDGKKKGELSITVKKSAR